MTKIRKSIRFISIFGTSIFSSYLCLVMLTLNVVRLHFKYILTMDVDIVVPIYNAFDFVKKCIETVVEYTDLTKHTLLLINDKSTDKRILPLLNSFIENNKALNIKLIDNKENRGFVGTVNIGMQYSQHDVILLNSDTEVTKNWLLKIQNCAYSKSAVATVTPLSNNATLASVPDFLSENVLPPNITVDEYAEIVEKCSMNLFPEIPTAHGFCMYIKREAIDDIGFFDEKTFGKGYGEENDFSYRCLQGGYRHLLCDNTYIYHKGSQSFSQEKNELINSHLQILKEKYPSCFANTESFVQQNPILEIQQNVRYGVELYSKKNILIIIHEFKTIKEKNIGGTTLHIYDLIENMRDEFNFHIVYYSIDEFKYYVSSYFSSDKITNILSQTYSPYTTLNLYNDAFKKDIEKLLSVLRIDLIHIHHLKNMYLDIFQVAEEKNIPIIYTLHDFYSLCPSIKLFNKETFLCDYTNSKGCSSCISQNFRQNVNFIPLWRKEFYKSLQIAQKIIVPSFSTKKIILNIYKDIEIDVIGHGYDKIDKKKDYNYSNKKIQKRFNIAFIGGILEEKGLKYLEGVILEAQKSDITIHLFGMAGNKRYNISTRNYIFHGPYMQKDLPNLLLENDIKLICLMSMWPETYSYTLSESLISEIPVITFDLGAIAERVKAIDAGWILPINSTSKDIFKLIRAIKSDHSEEYKKKIENIKHYLKGMKSTKDMANEYADLYNKLISRFPISHLDPNEIQSKLEFYKKSRELHPLKIKQMMEEKEYKLVKNNIKNPISLKQAFKEVQDYRNTYTDSKWRNKILLKFIWYRFLYINPCRWIWK